MELWLDPPPQAIVDTSASEGTMRRKNLRNEFEFDSGEGLFDIAILSSIRFKNNYPSDMES